MRRFITAVLALAIVVTGCTAGSTTPSGPKLLTIGVGALPPTMEPHNTSGFPAAVIFNGIFDPLVRFDESAKLQPALATAWSNTDPTTWRFSLRKDVKFQNGEPFTAEAVKVSYERVLDPNNKLSILNRLGSVKGVRVVDDYTVDITTKAPDPLLARNLSEVFILPPAYFKQAGDKGITEKPIGTGAFEFKEFVLADHVKLTAYAGSWRSRPKVDEVIVRAIPEAASRLAALQTGEIDIARDLPVDRLESLKSSGFTVITRALGRMAALRITPTEPPSPLQDVRVRQAVQYAVDLKAIAKNIMGGLVGPAQGQLVGPDGFGFDPSLNAYPFDQVMAKQLLTAAGFPNGFTIKLDTPSGINLNDKETADAIAGYLRQVGINAEINILDQAGFTARASGSNIAGRAPLMLYGPNYLPLLDADFPSSFYQTSHRAKLFSNPQFDATYLKSTSELDAKKREALLQESANILHREAVVLPLYQIPLVLGASSKVSGIIAQANETLWLDPIDKK